MSSPPFTYYEFFAGGGMARAGLGGRWQCLFANDYDPRKVEAYRANWDDSELEVGDVWEIAAERLQGHADLAWASSPCQDFSLAGRRAGLVGTRSSAFWGFWRHIERLHSERRAPKIVVIENVGGLLTSRQGADFAALCETLHRQDYKFGAVEIDAALFTPQSRPRIFIVATQLMPDRRFVSQRPEARFHSTRIQRAFNSLPSSIRSSWVWWNMPLPPPRNADLAAILEDDSDVEWHSAEQTKALLARLAPKHRQKIEDAGRGPRKVGTLCRRMRRENGLQVQRAEVRFDGLAGCLRTPGGGSSRQFVVVVEKDHVRTRGLTSREGARLMGLGEDYVLPKRKTRAQHLIGDGVVAPVVGWLAAQLIEPLLEFARISDWNEPNEERRRARA